MNLSLFERFIEQARDLQHALAATFQAHESEAIFESRAWTREERDEDGGGGTSLQLRGEVLERAVIGHSHVHGHDNPLTGRHFQAGGVSLIFHPANPHAPAVHMNLRRFEEAEHAWFGGVVDLNPMGFPYPEDTDHFHGVLQDVCAAHQHPYEAYADACEAYFRIPHRDRNRGVGGIFFDRLDTGDPEADLAFVLDVGRAFTEAYQPILQRRKEVAYDEADRRQQLVHRGYYVEFNLVYDEGTRFGFESEADPAAFLGSLPPVAAW